MFTFKELTIKNFLSVGAITQTININTNELTLILGENLDLGGSAARNGVGKTTMIQAICYALFGVPINSKDIRKDNLINRTNAKNMMVTLEFESNGISYKIERGRRPNTLKFYINSDLQESKAKDDAQGENKETQKAIDHAIGMTADMFKHIVILNTYSEPFLALGSNEQRMIIEQLLGITILSDKAEVVKDRLKINKETIQLEEFKVKAVEEANKRVNEQIDSLKRRQRLWLAKHDEDLNALVTDHTELSKIDIETELLAHKNLAIYNEQKKAVDHRNSILAKQSAWKQKQHNDVLSLQATYDKLSHIDIITELELHISLANYNKQKTDLQLINSNISNFQTSITKEKKNVTKLSNEISSLEENKCYACGQDFHDGTHVEVLANKKSLLDTSQSEVTRIATEIEGLKKQIFVLGDIPKPFYKTEAEAIRHSSELENIQHKITGRLTETDPYLDQLTNEVTIDIIKPNTHYDTEAEAFEHKGVLANLLQQIETKTNESDPYHDQIVDMESKAIQETNFDKINELTKLGDHLKFLLDVLTSKDSFVRKKIIDQNLSYLNTRLTNYLDKLGLPHTVIFKNDLTVEITELGRELDFGNLSRGERNRLILGLSFAFRDVWENLYTPINSIFIDELIDSGLDTIGVENAMAILKDLTRRRNKSIWLISHREELAGRVNSILKVVKENGFTSYINSSDSV